MNRAILYRRSNKRLVGIAFAVAIVIHVGAIALSANRPEPPSIVYIMPAIVDVTVDPTDSPPAVDISIPDPPTIPNLENDFRDEVRAAVRATRLAPIARPPNNRPAWFSNVKPSALSAPRPDYPYEARRRHETGSGIATLTIDPVSGVVVDAEMEQSIGSAILDGSTLSALRRWRFKPGTARRVRVPITFTLMGASF